MQRLATIGLIALTLVSTTHAANRGTDYLLVMKSRSTEFQLPQIVLKRMSGDPFLEIRVAKDLKLDAELAGGNERPTPGSTTPARLPSAR